MGETLTESYCPAFDGPPIRELTVGGLLREAAAEAPDATALVAGMPDPADRRRWTYAELLTESERVARALLARFEPGERVAVWAPNVPEWVMLEFGCGLAGVVLVTVNPAFQSQEVDYVLRQSGASGVITMGEFRGNPMLATVTELQSDLPQLREVISLADWDDFLASGDPARELPEVDPGAPAQIQYTSGTTGFPKGAVLHHRGIVNNARDIMERNDPPSGSAYVNPMPLFHTGGCVIGVLGCAWRRMAHVLVLAFDPGLVLELIETERSSSMAGVPTMLIAMIEHPDFATRDLSSVQVVTSGGSTVPEPLVRRIEESLGANFTIVFGQTECSPVATMTRPADSVEDKGRTLGQALPSMETKIIDPGTGDVVPIGEVGEFCTRGYHVMLGYHENPEATAEAIDADGWLHTGDLCSMDERGYCSIEGRLKDMIIRGGENIYPREIEDLLFAHPAIGEVAVVGIPDDTWGEIVGAFIRFAPGEELTETELRAYCRDHLAPHKTPVQWHVVDEFPLTGSGKIQKFKLAQQAAGGS
ncbi:MAG: AMP-binding protein [Actinomycetota bacterium]